MMAIYLHYSNYRIIPIPKNPLFTKLTKLNNNIFKNKIQFLFPVHHFIFHFDLCNICSIYQVLVFMQITKHLLFLICIDNSQINRLSDIIKVYEYTDVCICRNKVVFF